MSLRLPLALFVVSSLGLSALPASETKPAAASTSDGYRLQKRSTFTSPAGESRAPFWPIGWVKRKAGQPVQSMAAAPAPALLEEQNFKVSSILVGAPSMAIINGRTYTEGEFLRQPRTGSGPSAAPKIRVFRINDGRVVLQCETQLITLSLQRPELASKRQEAELLSEDRP